jgi:hypothetical protein
VDGATASAQPAGPAQPAERDEIGLRPVGGPVPVGWREGTLTRAKELEALSAWVQANDPQGNYQVLAEAIARHLEAARDAAQAAKPAPGRRLRVFRNGALLERALSNLDAAEAQLLNFAPDHYVLGQLPCLLRHVQCHLIPSDPGRQEFERIARQVGVKDADHPALQGDHEHDPVKEREERLRTVRDERGKIVTTVRAASSAKLREQVRVRSFRNVLVVTTVLMAVLAALVAAVGALWPTLIPLCFAPEESGQAVVVCPTAQSDPFVPLQAGGAGSPPDAAQPRDLDAVVADTATAQDLLVVEFVGLTAAAVAAAAAIRRVKGSSERYSLPVALAVLKLPTGAITAFLGLLLMRGQFVPGLSALDTSAQILAWALVFGYAQQLFTRLVDQQGQTVLESVRGADKAQPAPTPP